MKTYLDRKDVDFLQSLLLEVRKSADTNKAMQARDIACNLSKMKEVL